MFGLIVLPLFFVGNMAQIPLARPCNFTGMENFDITGLMGRWYEYLRYPVENLHSRCETDDFVENPDGTVILTVNFLPLNATSTNEAVITREMVDYSGSQMMLIPLEGTPFPMNCSVLSTDYESYLIKGYCVDDGPISLYKCWIFGRTNEPSQSVLEKIDQILKDLEIPEQYFEVMNQTNCEYT